MNRENGKSAEKRKGSKRKELNGGEKNISAITRRNKGRGEEIPPNGNRNE